MQQSNFYVGVDQCGPYVNAGFQVKFTNCTVSVQFGNKNYCGNKHSASIVNDGAVSCDSAEVAVLDANGDYLRGWPWCSNYEDVAGWLTPDQVADVIAWAKAYKP